VARRSRTASATTDAQDRRRFLEHIGYGPPFDEGESGDVCRSSLEMEDVQ